MNYDPTEIFYIEKQGPEVQKKSSIAFYKINKSAFKSNEKMYNRPNFTFDLLREPSNF